MPALALAQTRPTATEPGEARAQEGGDVERDALRARLRPRPSIRLGDRFQVELRGLLHVDGRAFSPEHEGQPDDWEVPRRRLGVEGEILRVVQFEVTAQLDDPEPWRDVYANYRAKPWLQVRGGHFKVPFGRERLTSISSIDFTERSLPTSNLTPGRDVGVMAHGRAPGRAVEYSAGVFRRDVDAGATGGDEHDAGTARTSWAARIESRPLRIRNRRGFGGLEVGANVSGSRLPPGLNSLRGESAWGYDYFDRVYVNGRRLRWGTDVRFTAGPASLAAEYLEAADQRRGQGVRDEDLPDLVARGWYVAATWVATGETKDTVERPRRPLFQGGVGAVELATRVERLRFASRDTRGELAVRHPRAVNLLPGADTAWNGGVNWYVNRYVRLQAFALRERFSEPAYTPQPGDVVFWSFTTRLQLAL